MSDTITVNGLHKCQPKNEPQQGEIKNMVVLNMPAKNGKKAWISIKNKKPEEGGSPYRILSVERLDWPPDQYQNVAFNIEVEASNSQPSQPTAFGQALATMQQGEPPQSYNPGPYPNAKPYPSAMTDDRPAYPNKPLQSPPHAQQGEDGVTEARKHLCKVANLYALCVRCANSHMIADEIPETHKTNEQFQSTLASIWIEASGRRSTNGVDWWSYIDLMPDKPLPVNGGKHSATVKPIQKEEKEEYPF